MKRLPTFARDYARKALRKRAKIILAQVPEQIEKLLWYNGCSEPKFDQIAQRRASAAFDHYRVLRRSAAALMTRLGAESNHALSKGELALYDQMRQGWAGWPLPERGMDENDQSA